MNRSVSARDFNKPTHSPRPRSIYLNQQTSKRDNSTPFHSPYKDGKPNPNYHNPSFISSHLFYPQEKTQPDQSKCHLTTNLIPNCNDRKKQTLYRERIRREQSVSPLKKSYRAREYTQSHTNKARILRSNEPETLMKNQLDNLQNYRQSTQKKKDRLIEISRRNDEPVQPVYLEKQRITPSKYEQPKNDQNLLQLTNQLRALKKQMKYSGHNYSQNVDRLIDYNRQTILQQQKQHRRQSSMLGNILRQQMKQSKPLKQRKWNF